ncbi:replication protein-like protein A 70 kDa DNA-binding subunit [Periconia macrospinosa]|uniref:Replication protein A subunit n=1 Tax=Periconia macrospinosa TaxID=97972 RepID=A0A2V1DPE0_9PLEO|nr:replication protein-like protein A 70 kDa DNA-binding subunit [Periconia macrospinosa]
MVDAIITQGAIRSIFEPQGCFVEHPILQCVQLKQMELKPGDSTQRWRVVLSDVRNFIQTVISLAANEIISSGKLRKGSIVRLLKYNPQQVKDKKILIIMDLEVLEEHGEHDKIGNPVALEAVTSEPQPAAISGSNFYGNTAQAPQQQQQRQQQQQQQRSIPVHQSNPTATSHMHLYPIESINMFITKWTIRARCTYKSDMRTWHNARGEGKLFSVNLLDESDEIRATAFNDVAEKVFPLLEVGTVYYISAPARVQMAKKDFSKLSHDYELHFQMDTLIEKAEDQDNKPQIRYNFTKIGNLLDVEKDTTIDTIGVLKEVGQVETITSSKTNRDFQKRELILADDTQTSVKLTVWGQEAQSFEAPVESILAFKGVKVSDFGGRSLSLLSSGTMTVDPDIDEAHKLRGWFNAVGQNTTFTTHQNLSSGSGGNSKNETKLISEIIADESYLQQETATYINLTASIWYVKSSSFAYPACTTTTPTPCNKKVVEIDTNEWRCEKCNLTIPQPRYRYVLSVNLVDHTGTIYVTCFDETAQLIVGMDANAATKLKLDDDDNATKNADTALRQACGQTFNFTLKAKMETYNDEPKPRYQVLRAHPLNYSQEANKLAQLIKQYDINDDSLFVQ